MNAPIHPKYLLVRIFFVIALGVAITLVSANLDSQEQAANGPAAVADKDAPKTTEQPQQQKKKKREAKGEDRFAVPKTKDEAALVQFVEGIDAFLSEATELNAETTAKANAAIRQACEKILAQAKRDRVSAQHFARHRVLQLDLEKLQDQEDADVPPTLLDETEKFLKLGNLTKADAKLARDLCALVEDREGAEKAKLAYARFGKIIAEQSDATIVRLGKTLLGAGRRLGIVGEPMEVKGKTLAGDAFDLSSLKGKVVLVDFWTTWCSHCRDEIPNLKRCYSAYKAKGFEVVSINCDAEREKLDRFRKIHQLPWINLHDDEAGTDQPAAVYYGIVAYPSVFLLDQDGKVVSTDARGRKLRKQLRKLLGTPAQLHAADQNIVAVNNEEVVDQLMDASEALIKSGNGKDLLELRKNIGRKTWPVELLPTATKQLTDKEIYRQTVESVFIIGGLHREKETDEWEVAMGTAFVVGADGVLCTSCHVFQDDLKMNGMIAMDLRGHTYPIEEILAADAVSDTCFFRVNAKGLRPIPLGNEAQPGEITRVLSHPGNMFYFYSTGLVSNYYLDDDGATWMNVTADFGQGASGAPVLDACGNVIGQVSRTSTLFASGEEAIGRRQRPAAPATSEGTVRRPPIKTEAAGHDANKVSEPQMVFKSCTPVTGIRKLVEKK